MRTKTRIFVLVSFAPSDPLQESQGVSRLSTDHLQDDSPCSRKSSQNDQVRSFPSLALRASKAACERSSQHDWKEGPQTPEKRGMAVWVFLWPRANRCQVRSSKLAIPTAVIASPSGRVDLSTTGTNQVRLITAPWEWDTLPKESRSSASC
jgi:hypothetical protein